MAVLTRDVIISLIKQGIIKIEPFSFDQIGPASIDLHLSNVFRIFKKSREVFDVKEDLDYNKITELIRIKKDEGLLLLPGELVHGVTREKITLPGNISARIEGRSRFARIGLVVHLSSGFVHPGNSSNLVLEIANLSPIPLRLYSGVKICQVILERTEGNVIYKGKFRGQVTP